MPLGNVVIMNPAGFGGSVCAPAVAVVEVPVCCGNTALIIVVRLPIASTPFLRFDTKSSKLAMGTSSYYGLIMVKPSVERIKECLSYNSATGLFMWRVKPHIHAYIPQGSNAGWQMLNGYIAIGLDGHQFYAHRLAWFFVHGVWPKQIDHINRDKSDNRLCNLREASFSENAVNRDLRSDNKSGTTGVSYDRNRQKWQVRVKGQLYGRFDSKKEAIVKRHIIASSMFGPFLPKL